MLSDALCHFRGISPTTDSNDGLRNMLFDEPIDEMSVNFDSTWYGTGSCGSFERARRIYGAQSFSYLDDLRGSLSLNHIVGWNVNSGETL